MRSISFSSRSCSSNSFYSFPRSSVLLEPETLVMVETERDRTETSSPEDDKSNSVDLRVEVNDFFLMPFWINSSVYSGFPSIVNESLVGKLSANDGTSVELS